ncbi:hypothetical protein [Phyllobacterium sp. 22552]|uniref:hypothetical protein n=1 Tax=Phyllobacterium sp. 22552 TaxID=3453941 RepID=UPI003F84D485
MDKIERWNFPYQSGDEIAEILINDAKRNGGIASLSSIADKVCVSADGVGPNRNIDKFFRDIPVKYIETDASEGVWFIYIQHNNSVIIYGVSQTVLKWGSIMEDPPTPYNQNELCPQSVQISDWHGRPSITRFLEE